MTIRFLFGALLLIAVAEPVGAASCPEGPLRPIDFFSLVPGEISFAAAPSLQSPDRAYVIRISPETAGRAQPTIEVIQLLRSTVPGCFKWVQEKRWQAPLTIEEYAEVIRAARAMAVPGEEVAAFGQAWLYDAGVMDRTPNSMSPPAAPPPPPPMDGTALKLRVRSSNWEVSREGHHATAQGAAMSAVFYPLVSKYLPASDVPTPDWRTTNRK